VGGEFIGDREPLVRVLGTAGASDESISMASAKLHWPACLQSSAGMLTGPFLSAGERTDAPPDFCTCLRCALVRMNYFRAQIA
jgi:hypothetical protein